MNIIIPLENAMKNELCIFSNPPLISEKGIKNPNRGRKIVGVITRHPAELIEGMHCIQISII